MGSFDASISHGDKMEIKIGRIRRWEFSMERIILRIDQGGSSGLNWKSHAACDNLGIDQCATSVRSQKVVEGGRLQNGSVLSSR